MSSAHKNLSIFSIDNLPDVSSKRFAIVVAEWNENITEGLFNGAYQALIENQVPAQHIIRWNVPGSFELIFGAKQMHEKLQLDAVIVIGCVIKGETMHFEFVCEGVTQGIKDLNLKYTIPTIFCIWIDNTMQQSLDRSGGKHGNKGVESAIAAIKMVELNKK